MFFGLDQNALFHVPPLYRQEGNEVIDETFLDQVAALETTSFAECTLSYQSLQVSERNLQ